MRRAGRLTSSGEFRRAYTEGKRAAIGTVVVHVRATGEDHPPRIGVSVARGIRTAVERNRIKRRLREAVRQVEAELPEGADAVVAGSAATGSEDYQDLVNNLRAALARAGS